MLTAVNTVPLLIELLQVKPLLLAWQSPLDVFKVKPLPEAVKVMVAQVWVLQVPAVRRQPTLLPLEVRPLTVPLEGTPVGDDPPWNYESE